MRRRRRGGGDRRETGEERAVERERASFSNGGYQAQGCSYFGEFFFKKAPVV